MPKWNRNTTRINDEPSDSSESHVCVVPKSMVEKIGIRSAIKFGVKGKKILITIGGEQNEYS